MKDSNIINTEYIARALGGRRCGRGWIAKCPAHDDKTPSLSIREGDRVPVIVCCFRGCLQADIIDALRARGLWPEKPRDAWTPADRQRWAAERREFERKLPAALLFRDGALRLTDESIE